MTQEEDFILFTEPVHLRAQLKEMTAQADKLASALEELRNIASEDEEHGGFGGDAYEPLCPICVAITKADAALTEYRSVCQ